MKKLLLWIVVILLVVGGGLYLKKVYNNNQLVKSVPATSPYTTTTNNDLYRGEGQTTTNEICSLISFADAQRELGITLKPAYRGQAYRTDRCDYQYVNERGMNIAALRVVTEKPEIDINSENYLSQLKANKQNMNYKFISIPNASQAHLFTPTLPGYNNTDLIFVYNDIIYSLYMNIPGVPEENQKKLENIAKIIISRLP